MSFVETNLWAGMTYASVTLAKSGILLISRGFC